MADASHDDDDDDDVSSSGGDSVVDGPRRRRRGRAGRLRMDVDGESDDVGSADDDSNDQDGESTLYTSSTTESSASNTAADPIAKVRQYFASPDEWLQGATGQDAVELIDSVEFEVARILDEEAGEEGPRFKATAEYDEGCAKLAALKRQHESPLPQQLPPPPPPPPPPHAAATNDNDNGAAALGPHGALLGLISDGVLNEPRYYKVLLCALRSEAAKSENEVVWKAAGLALHQRRRRQRPTPGAGADFEAEWRSAVDRRLDKRVVTHFARLSGAAAFLSKCRELSFGDTKERTRFSEVELRDYFLLAYGDDLVRVQDAKGTAVWFLRKWKWDATERVVQHMIMSAVQNLYTDLLNQHRDERGQIAHDAALTEDEKKMALSNLEGVIAKTAKALAAYGNQQNKNVTALVVSQLEAHGLEVDPFDSDRLIFAFTNKVYHFQSGAFTPHFKFDYALTNCGREWREPSAAQLAKVRAVVESIMPDEDERKMLVTVLRNGLSGVRPERFVIFTGDGRNGKGLLIEWLQFLLGEYGGVGALSVITEKQKSGPNTELRGQHKKRAVIYSEPEEAAVEAIRLSEIKRLTGNATINARGLFDARDKTEMHALQLLECNTLPNILGDKGESARERVAVLHFPFTFTDDAAKLASTERATDDSLGHTLDEPKYKRIDTSLKDAAFKEEHYCAFFKYLVESYRTPIEGDADGVGVYVSAKAKQRAGKYLDAHDPVPAWMDEHYYDVSMPDASAEAASFNSYKDLYADFKQTSEFYQSLRGREKTLMN